MSDKPFVPPIFKKFGKSATDFLKQKFSYERQLKIRTSTSNGIRITTTGVANKTGDFSGGVEGQYKHSDVGLFKAELKTSGSTEATVEADKIIKGALFRLVVSDAPKYQADVEYSQDMVSGTLNFDNNKGNTILGASAAVGFDGIAVGGEAKFDAKKSEVSDFNAGFEYTQSDFTGTVKTREKADAIDVLWFQTVNPDLSVGGKADYKFSSREWGLTGLVGFKFDDRTGIKATANNKGVVAAVLEQNLANPAVLLRFAAEFDVTKYSTVPEKFGISLFFGGGYTEKD